MALNLRSVQRLKRLVLSGRATSTSVPGVLVGNIQGIFGPSGALTVIQPVVLTGSISGAGSLAGTMTIGPAPVALTGSVPGSGTLSGSLTRTTASGLVQARKGRLVAALAA